jgi:hypothetical protein
VVEEDKYQSSESLRDTQAREVITKTLGARRGEILLAELEAKRALKEEAQTGNERQSLPESFE